MELPKAKMSTSRRSDQAPQPNRRLHRTQTAGNLGESIFDSEVVPSSLVEIAPILRVANEVESSNPRVAYLCKFHALIEFAPNVSSQLCLCCIWYGFQMLSQVMIL